MPKYASSTCIINLDLDFSRKYKERLSIDILRDSFLQSQLDCIILYQKLIQKFSKSSRFQEMDLKLECFL